MRKKFFRISILLVLLLLSACTAKPVKKEPTQPEQLQQSGDVCLGCKERYVSGQLNADFGLCWECMAREGTTYCQNCKTPGYTRDMVYGLCENCSAAIEETTEEPADIVFCKRCDEVITHSQSQGGYCAACYADIQRQEAEKNKPKCSYCGVAYGDADPLVCGICQNCWGQGYGPASTCRWCGKHYTADEGFEGICFKCEEKYGPKCKVCSASLLYQGGVDGMCYSCYDASQRCIKCGTDSNEYDGYCYYCHPSFGFNCVRCGYGYPAHRPADGICPECRCDECGEVLSVRGGNDGLCDDCYEAPQGCIKCGVEANEYDGYCYYCHPDFGYICVLCGYGYPEHRPADGICPRCRCDKCGAILAVPYGKDDLCDACYEASQG